MSNNLFEAAFRLPFDSMMWGAKMMTEGMGMMDRACRQSMDWIPGWRPRDGWDDCGCRDRPWDRCRDDRDRKDDCGNWPGRGWDADRHCSRLVEYGILYVKRGHEKAYRTRQELVTGDITEREFKNAKIAEFVRSGKGKGIPDKDLKYLRVWCKVLDTYRRKRFHFEERQIEVLEEIRDELKS